MSVKHFSSKTDCQTWLDDHYGEREYEDGVAVHVDSKINADGWTISHIWAVRLPSGEYLTGEEAPL